MGQSVSDVIFGREQILETSELVERRIDKAQDDLFHTGRNVMVLSNNLRGDVLYTVRDIKHEGLTFLDATIDNVALVIDRQASNLFETIQISALIGSGLLVFFIVLHGDKLLANGVRLGKLSFL